MEIWKQEILKVEADFAAMAARDGIASAFLYFAAEDAVLMRNDQLFIGRAELEELFASGTSQPRDAKLRWKPDFVDVSASGDLAYTYGSYTYSYIDSTGAAVEQSGIFHTVWKRQADGSWRFVWD
jgi:ketosteroid isomerase-like protein